MQQANPWGINPRYGQLNLPAIGSDEAGEGTQQRGLPRPVLTDEPHQLTMGDGEGYIGQNPETAKGMGETRDPKMRSRT